MLKAHPGKARRKTCDLAHIFHAKIGMYASMYDFFKIQVNREVEQMSLNWNETSTVVRKSPFWRKKNTNRISLLQFSLRFKQMIPHCKMKGKSHMQKKDYTADKLVCLVYIIDPCPEVERPKGCHWVVVASVHRSCCWSASFGLHPAPWTWVGLTYLSRSALTNLCSVLNAAAFLSHRTPAHLDLTSLVSKTDPSVGQQSLYCPLALTSLGEYS